jgi:hypothetical protein
VWVVLEAFQDLSSYGVFEGGEDVVVDVVF